MADCEQQCAAVALTRGRPAHPGALSYRALVCANVYQQVALRPAAGGSEGPERLCSLATARLFPQRLPPQFRREHSRSAAPVVVRDQVASTALAPGGTGEARRTGEEAWQSRAVLVPFTVLELETHSHRRRRMAQELLPCVRLQLRPRPPPPTALPNAFYSTRRQK